jgi:hypothetical protein
MGWGIIKQGSFRHWPGYFLIALLMLVLLTLALSEILALSALTFSALPDGLMVLIALVSTYRWSDIVEKSGKWVRIWRGMILPVTLRVSGVARQVAGTVVLSEGWTDSKTVVSSPAPTRQNKA